jgi:hypothetical protein
MIITIFALCLFCWNRLDPNALKSALSSPGKYGVSGIPAAFVVGKTGKIEWNGTRSPLLPYFLSPAGWPLLCCLDLSSAAAAAQPLFSVA